mmetsp:Transcript_17144/g.37879  ORF Transcript_17144/g.37879 Transcript_17144/m.37879 type:complete len:1186 (-) Transcript_17144:79-3636(-)
MEKADWGPGFSRGDGRGRAPTEIPSIPFNGAVTRLAFASAILAIASSILLHPSPPDSGSDWDDPSSRSLQVECTAFGVNFEENTAVSTWAAIRSTSFVSLTIGVLCLLGYEIFRRDPIVGKYVYDRKRLARPTKTPPPLMLSRSLWTGDYKDEEETDEETLHTRRKRRGGCCRVFPAVLEIIFFNLDANYIRYSRAADEARRRREQNGIYTCCRTGCFHNNCCNEIYTPNTRFEDNNKDDENFVNEDGYVLYPGHPCDRRNAEPSWERTGNEAQAYSPTNNSDRRSGSLQTIESITRTGSVRLRSLSLFDEDSHRKFVQKKWRKTISDLFPEDETKTDIVSLSDEDEEDAADRNRGRLDAIPSRDYSIDCSMVANEKSQSRAHAQDSNVDDTTDRFQDDESDPQPRYPSRLAAVCMPPGFHNWTTAVAFLADFLLFDQFQKLSTSTMKHFPSVGSSTNGTAERRDDAVHVAQPGRDLMAGDVELLRCAGFDTFLLIRLARFGFDVTCYPFLFSCVAILPMYWTSPNKVGAIDDDYLSMTINRVEDGSFKLALIMVFQAFLYTYILRRLWIEWEVFIKLRHEFLIDGDTSFDRRPSYMRKFRNSVMVECIPPSHRSDKSLRQVFESLFPGQIQHAEMLIDTTKLERILAKRQKLISKCDSVDARYKYMQWYDEKHQKKKPTEPPIVKEGGYCCGVGGEETPALPYYENKLRDEDENAQELYDYIVEARLRNRNDSFVNRRTDSLSGSKHGTSPGLQELLVPERIQKLFGKEEEFFSGTGIVEFKSIATKQTATQCNLSGQSYWMITSEAPDPRDILWVNISVDRRVTDIRNVIVQVLLFAGLLGWGTINTYITSIVNKAVEGAGVKEGFLYGFLPVGLITLILIQIPNLFFALAKRVIRFKSLSKVDEFTLLWNTCYRLTNIFFVFFSVSLLEAVQCFRDDPDKFVTTLAAGIMRQSTILMNLMILATGQETMLQLLQWRSIIKNAICRPLCHLNSKSSRYVSWLNECPPFEQGFLFGYFAPVLSYGLIIALIYSFTAPIMLGVCTVFFWTATKVHTNNALFVYCQRCESGGKLFYYWNRIVFISLYCSIIVFSGVLVLKQFPRSGVAFFIIGLSVIFFTDRAIKSKFVVHSLHLPMSKAIIHDTEEAAALISDTNKKSDKKENFMYRSPELNHANWDTAAALHAA